MKRSLISWYLPAFILVMAGAMAVFALFMDHRIYTILMGIYREHLAHTAELTQSILSAQKGDVRFEAINNRFASRQTTTRLTVIMPDGTVVADTHYRAELLDNHADRPEIKSAFSGNPAFSDRRSDTLRMNMLYYALPVTEEGRVEYVIRTSMPMKEIASIHRMVRSSVTLVGGIILLAASIFSWIIHRKTSMPLEKIRDVTGHYAQGEWEYPLHIEGPPAIRNLADDIQSMARELLKRVNLVTRQRNELEAIFSSMIEAVVVLDENLVIKALNPAACRLAGKQRADVPGKHLIEVFRNSDLEKAVIHSLDTGKPVESEIVYTVPVTSENPIDGGLRERTLQVHGSTFRTGTIGKTDEEAHNRILLVLHDISELKRLEQIRKDFVANVSHELRTPITSLKGYVETLLDGALEDRAAAGEFLEIIALQTERIHAIVSDLLSLSRLEQAGSTIETEYVSIKTPVDGALRVCRLKTEEKNIHIHLSCPHDLAANINTLLIEQAVVNLIDNAIHYSEPGSDVHVAIEPRGEWIAIMVQDQGCGIPQKDIPRLFERFYRVDKGRSRELGGTGLGLAIVKHIALAHNGGVDVRSIEGKGSKFTLYLPLSKGTQ